MLNMMDDLVASRTAALNMMEDAQQARKEAERAEEELLQTNLALEQRVVERTAELAATNKELEAFAYSISHDLKAPLRQLDGFSRILMEEHATELDEEGHRITGVLQGTVARMARLVDELLAFSQVGRQELARSSVEPEPMVRAVFEALVADEPDREIQLEVSDLPTVFADRALLRQVCENLLSNAVKFTGPRDVAVIEVGGERRDAEDVLCVRDNGVGFDMRYVDKLFQVFERLHYPDEFPGTGAGLAIAERIVSRHGGRIWAESEPQKGATLHIVLPRKGRSAP